MHKTVLVKLEVPKQDARRLQATFSDYKTAWQLVSDYVFANKCRNRSKVHHATYQQVREKLPNLSSALVQEARNDAIAKAKSAKSNRHNLKVAPQLKRISIRFDKRTASLTGNILSFTANGGKRIKVELVDFPFLQKHRCYKSLAPVIFNRNGQYWAAITFDVPEILASSGSILGIDMGLRNLAALSDGRLIKGSKLNRLRRKTRFLKAALQRKGTKSAKRHLRRISLKEKRQSRDVIHCSVNEVLKTEASILAIEDLDLRARKYRKDANRRRFSVPISAFTNTLEYKARLRGKQVVRVKPHFTSQDDCRGLERGTRSGGKYVGIDGKVMNADLNAACNIALKAKSCFPDGKSLQNSVILCYSSNTDAKNDRQGAVNRPIVRARATDKPLSL